MPLTESDPLADSLPPRYAVESDEDEDELNPLGKSQEPSSSQNLKIKIIGKLVQHLPLVVASGKAGSYWARGAQLGEQVGAVAVNGVQMGLLFTPEWTHSRANILVSEAFSTLPLWAMHPYVQVVVEQLAPSRLSLLDTYAVPSYISNEPVVPAHDAPLRYLTTTAAQSKKFNGKAVPFTPPNLIQYTSAAFLSSTQTVPQIEGSLLLLPAAHIPPPPPRTMPPPHLPDSSSSTETGNSWSLDIMRVVHGLLFAAIGEIADIRQWDDGGANVAGHGHGDNKSSAKKSRIGDGSMYI